MSYQTCSRRPPYADIYILIDDLSTMFAVFSKSAAYYFFRRFPSDDVVSERFSRS